MGGPNYIISRAQPVELIPSACIDFLPFQNQPLAEWSSSDDLHDFLTRLFDLESVMLDEAGREQTSNTADYGDHLYRAGLKRYTEWSEKFRERALEVEPAPGSRIKEPQAIPRFSRDPLFGLMAKYAIAWSAIIDATLSEDGFFSLAHTVESEDDAQCSIILASNLYYRQASQILRNVLEDVFVQMYFSQDRDAFARWRSGDFNIPPLRRKGGLLDRLAKTTVLPRELSDTAKHMYGKLNASVHGEEDLLVNAGLFKGKWTGLPFRRDRFSRWCRQFASTIDISIRAQRITTNRWIEVRPNGPFCSTCHSADLIETRSYDFGGKQYVDLRCPTCDSSMTWGPLTSDHAES